MGAPVCDIMASCFEHATAFVSKIQWCHYRQGACEQAWQAWQVGELWGHWCCQSLMTSAVGGVRYVTDQD